MESLNLTVEEREAMLEFLGSEAVRPLFKILDFCLTPQEKELRTGALMSVEDEKRFLYARSRFDGAEKVIRDVKSLLSDSKRFKSVK